MKIRMHIGYNVLQGIYIAVILSFVRSRGSPEEIRIPLRIGFDAVYYGLRTVCHVHMMPGMLVAGVEHCEIRRSSTPVSSTIMEKPWAALGCVACAEPPSRTILPCLLVQCSRSGISANHHRLQPLDLWAAAGEEATNVLDIAILVPHPL